MDVIRSLSEAAVTSLGFFWKAGWTDRSRTDRFVEFGDLASLSEVCEVWTDPKGWFAVACMEVPGVE